jgi:hypothetical protein
LYFEFWEDDGEIRLEDERAWILYIYFESDRNPYVFCLHHIKNVGRDRDTTSIRLKLKVSEEWPGGIPVHLRRMVVRWEGLRRRWSRMRRSLTGKTKSDF